MGGGKAGTDECILKRDAALEVRPAIVQVQQQHAFKFRRNAFRIIKYGPGNGPGHNPGSGPQIN